MIVFDTSGSMSGTPLSNAQDGAKTLVGSLGSGADIGLVEFSTSATLVSDLGTNRSDLNNSIDSLSALGQTDVQDGIDLGQQELETNGSLSTPNFLVVLADGDHNEPGSPRTAATNAQNNGTQIISIAYTSGADEDLMEDISSPPKVDDGTIDDQDENAFLAVQADISSVFENVSGVISDEATVQDFELDYEQPGNVSGEVSLETPVDPDENVSVDVEVEETGNSTTIDINGSDTSGSYQIDDIPVNVDNDGNYTVTANANNYLPNSTSSVNVSVDATTGDVDLTLTRKTGSLNGTVTASGDTNLSTTNVPTGEGIENAAVRVYAFTDSAGGTLVGSTTTDANGSYSITGIPVTSASNHTVEVAGAANFSTPVNQSDVAVEANTTTTGVDFALDYADPGSVSGSISLEEPVDPDENVSVTVEVEETGNSTTIDINESATSGSYQIDDIPVNVDNDGNRARTTTTTTARIRSTSRSPRRRRTWT